MRILYLSPYTPEPVTFGGRLRSRALWRGLRRHAEVTLWVLGDTPRHDVVVRLEREGVRFWSAREESPARRLWRCVSALTGGRSIPGDRYLWRERYAELEAAARELRPDVTVLGNTFMVPLLPMAARVSERVIVDTQNVESVLYRRLSGLPSSWTTRMGNRLLALNAARLERRYFPLASSIWAASESDAVCYRKHLGLPQVVRVPNVVDLTRYDAGLRPEAGCVGFAGLYAYPPNEDAALTLIAMSKSMAERGVPHRLLLIGGGVTERMRQAAKSCESVEITGFVEDAPAVLSRAAVVAAPIRAGGGIKYKVLEAMALGRAVVTTDMGAEGLNNGPKDCPVVVPLEGFRNRLEALLVAPDLCGELGRAGRQFVEEHFSESALERSLVLALR